MQKPQNQLTGKAREFINRFVPESMRTLAAVHMLDLIQNSDKITTRVAVEFALKDFARRIKRYHWRFALLGFVAGAAITSVIHAIL